MSKQKINRFVGSIGAFIGFLVFIAYIPQIIANLQGSKGQPFQPLFAAVSCLIWVIYGWTKEPKKDWILIKHHTTLVTSFLKTVFKFLTEFHKHLVELFLGKSAAANECLTVRKSPACHIDGK